MVDLQWNNDSVRALFKLPFFELVSRAHAVHQANFPVDDMELCTLSSIKTGACPEDCAYCPQSGHYNTGLKKERLLDIDVVLEQARAAKANGAARFCMGAAWRSPPKSEFPKVLKMVREVKAMGLEACVTLGMLNAEEAVQLKEAGLDFYNHNLDTSPEFYENIITTRTYDDRLETLMHVSNADINVCCGGILGMGETREDRVQFLMSLYALPTAPRSIPINKLIAIKGTPLEKAVPLDTFEFVRTIAVARILFPTTRVRLSAGREEMTNEAQAWCFMAGANSIFIGDKLLTAGNPSYERDRALLSTLGFSLPATAHVDAVC